MPLPGASPATPDDGAGARATSAAAAECRAPIELPPPRRDYLDRGRAWEVADPDRDVIRVHDLDFAAYLLVSGLAIVHAVEGRGPRERVFDFYDPKREIRKLAVDYMNAPEARFADAVRRLKKVSLSSWRAREPR